MSGAFDIQDPAGVFPGSQPAQPASPPPAGDNEAREREFVNQIRRLGRESGAGREALPNLVVAIVDGINTGALNPSKEFRNERGEKVAVEHWILEQYSNEEGKKLAHERTSLGKRTAASKIKQIIKAARQKAPEGQPEFNFRGAIDRAIEVRASLVEKNSKANMKPAFDTYVSMARKQLKNKSHITDEDIAEAAVRKAGYQNNFVMELKRMYSRLKKLLSNDEKVTVRISPDEEIYTGMEEVATTLEQAIQVYEPEFNKPAAPAEQTYSQQLAEHNRTVEQQLQQ